jgi:hypothetical protein
MTAIATARWLSKYWGKVVRHCNTQDTAPIPLTLSVSDNERAILTASFEKVDSTAKARTARARYIVRSDISKFYPSIYTHSIPWALNGRGRAKLDRDRTSNSVYANYLDWAVRIGQDGQTKGIPVGPDSSRVIAEIIGTSIDQLVCNSAGSQIAGYLRNIDDFYIGARSLTDAEHVLRTLQSAVRDFALELNDEKTTIVEARRFFDESWAFELDTNEPLDRKTIDRAVDRAFLHASNSNSDSAIRFLIRRIDRALNSPVPLPLLFSDVETALLRAFVNFPHCIDYVMLLLIGAYARRQAFDAATWRHAINQELAHHIPSGHDHEICWLQTAALFCRLKLDELPFAEVRHPLAIALLYLLSDKGLISKRFDLADWTPLIELAPGGFWLLFHEGRNRGWFKKGKANSRYRTGIEELFDDSLTFLDDNYVSRFRKQKSAYRRSIPDRYKRYDDFDDSNHELAEEF